MKAHRWKDLRKKTSARVRMRDYAKPTNDIAYFLSV